MSKFIEITTQGGKRTINTNHIVTFRQYVTGDIKTLIRMSFDDDVLALESYEEVKRLVTKQDTNKITFSKPK